MTDGSRLSTALLVVVVVLLALVVLVEFRGERVAVAQSEMAAAHIIGLTGQVSATQQPIYIIDTRSQVLLVYEYRLNGQGLGLMAARSFKYDKEILEFNPMDGQLQKSPSVQEVQRQVGGARR
jgi:hypothetical protein